MKVPDTITETFLQENKNLIYVFGDNMKRYGKRSIRDEPNTYGFITKKSHNNHNRSFYTIKEYRNVYKNEISKLKFAISKNSDKIFIISKLGALANKFNIRNLIQKHIYDDLYEYTNVLFIGTDEYICDSCRAITLNQHEICTSCFLKNPEKYNIITGDINHDR